MYKLKLRERGETESGELTNLLTKDTGKKIGRDTWIWSEKPVRKEKKSPTRITFRQATNYLVEKQTWWSYWMEGWNGEKDWEFY